jgi:hypothetical protein
VAEEGGLAATARSEEEKQFAFLDAQIDAVQGCHLAELFGQIFDGDGGHIGRAASMLVSASRGKPANVTELSQSPFSVAFALLLRWYPPAPQLFL